MAKVKYVLMYLYVFTILQLNLGKQGIIFPMIVISASAMKELDKRISKQQDCNILSPGYALPKYSVFVVPSELFSFQHNALKRCVATNYHQY